MTAANKVYDGTTSATLTSCTLTGVVGGDVVSCTGTAAFATASVGAGKTVTVSGLTLAGAAAGNYTLATHDGDDDAAITAATVTPAVTAANKVYDGTTSATVTSCTLTGVVGGDVVSCTGTAAFATASVGAGKTVTVERPDAGGRGRGQLHAGERRRRRRRRRSPRSTVTPAVTAANKVYDGTTTATLTSCTLDRRDRRRRGDLHGHGGVRHGERRARARR